MKVDEVQAAEAADKSEKARMGRFYRMLGWSALAYLGIGMAIYPFVEFSPKVLEFLKKLLLTLPGLFVFFFAFILMTRDSRRRRLANDRFVDVDERAIRKEVAQLKEALAKAEMSDGGGTSHSHTSGRTGAIPDWLRERNFEAYFSNLRDVLESKATVADQKASILLDKGVAYSRLGILVFVASIILWQFVAWSSGFKAQHIYGIVSCSLLFIFIEFLSAWFLKQYRHFVDTSTYLIKVKSIFDRYLLSYYVAKEFDLLDGEEKEGSQMAAVLALLRDDVKWPDDYMFKNADVNFARETLQSVSDLLKAARESKDAR